MASVTYWTGVEYRRCGTVYQQVQEVHKFDRTDTTILNDLVSKVFVEAPDKSDGKRRQNIHISYDLVGILPELNNPIHEEMA